ncbi:hypothetical protein [Trichocoleus sp. DQ-U1]|uniref:hypothetical protein n=1 Tax=Trichocoleus sp. DQ-U1 TaxID=2933926 RepID=UPI00329A44CC
MNKILTKIQPAHLLLKASQVLSQGLMNVIALRAHKRIRSKTAQQATPIDRFHNVLF